MKTASLHEIKEALNNEPTAKLLTLCLKLARFKKENKELLTYLLFEAENPDQYIHSIKSLMDQEFAELPKANLYLTKKSLRKILRITTRYCKYASDKQIEASLLIHFCSLYKNSPLSLDKSVILNNIYQGQIKKATEAVSHLHPDLQYDYQKELTQL